MKIAIDALNLQPGCGGVEWFLRHLLVEFRRRDSEADFLIFTTTHAGEPLPAEREGFRYRRVGLPRASRLARSAYQQALLPGELRKTGADVLHSGAYLCPLRARLPVVLTVHDILALTHPHLCKRLNALHYSFMLPRSLHRADVIVASSSWTRIRILERWPELEERTRVVHPGVAPVFMEKVGEETVERVLDKLGIRRPYLLFAGSIEPKKNVPLVVEAFAILKRTHRIPHGLVLAGRTNWLRGSALDDALREAGGDVLLPGTVTVTQLAALYTGAEALLFPSLAEGFGIPPLEAMACGCPVVASNIPTFEETLGEAALRVPTDAAEPLADAVMSLISQDDVRHKLVEAGRARAADFTYARTADGYTQAYMDAAGGPC